MKKIFFVSALLSFFLDWAFLPFLNVGFLQLNLLFLISLSAGLLLDFNEAILIVFLSGFLYGSFSLIGTGAGIFVFLSSFFVIFLIQKIIALTTEGFFLTFFYFFVGRLVFEFTLTILNSLAFIRLDKETFFWSASFFQALFSGFFGWLIFVILKKRQEQIFEKGKIYV